jgi:hypothetical protein
VAWTLSSEGLLSFGEPTCSAESRSFGTTATTWPLLSAHKNGMAFHPPLWRAIQKFTRGGIASDAQVSKASLQVHVSGHG